MVLCECGCGGEIVIQKHHKYYGIPKYIHGHNPTAHEAWNKGKTGVYSAETLEKMRNAQLGKRISEEQRRILSKLRTGLPPWNKGKKGYKMPPCSEERKIKIGKSNSGPRSPRWKGGVSFEPYCPRFNRELKESIRNKYERRCFLCGKLEAENKRKLSIHHVDYDKEQGCNGKKFELVPLCMSCHAKTGISREYYKSLIIEKLKSGD